MLDICLAALDTEEDHGLFRRIYETYRQEMYAAAYRILNNEADAEDAVQQAFISIADHFEKIKSISCQEMGAYVVMISRNAARNIYKSNKRRAGRSAILHETSAVLDADLLERIEFQELVNIIASLPPIYKDVLMMRYLYGFTARESAAMLGISLGTFWKRSERAKKMLSEALERGNYNAG